MPDRSKDPSPDELSQRLDALGQKLGASGRGVKDRQHEPTSSDKAGIAQAFKLSSEFIAGVIVGGVLGYAVDTFFGTSPWGLIIFLLLGFCAAVLNVLRASGAVAESKLGRHKEPSSAGAEQPSQQPDRNGAGKER